MHRHKTSAIWMHEYFKMDFPSELVTMHQGKMVVQTFSRSMVWAITDTKPCELLTSLFDLEQNFLLVISLI